MKTETKRQRHDEEFKQQAVDLLLISGRQLKPLARELGVTPTALRGWRDRHLAGTSPQCRDASILTLVQLREQNERLRRENDALRIQRDILKKAVGIFSEPPPRGMP
jgi:transposase